MERDVTEDSDVDLSSRPSDPIVGTKGLAYPYLLDILIICSMR